jgi:DNA-binding protein H-NS
VIGRIRHAIAVYHLSAEDLGFGARAPRASQGAAPAKRKVAQAPGPKLVKFRNEDGGTWGGRGKRPQWLRDALATGKTLHDFAV